MHFYYADVWDKGDYYPLNQDSFAIQTVLTGSGPFALAVVCDGIGSLTKGEYASGFVTAAMTTWFYEQALTILCGRKTFGCLKRSFYRALLDVHLKLCQEGELNNGAMGTTISLLILTAERYFVFHAGDCRSYKVGRKIVPLTKDQINEKGELLYAVGMGEMPHVIIKKGRYDRKDSFLLCSDGFGRCLTKQGITALCGKNTGKSDGKRKIMQEIVNRGRLKGERDNCTGILLKKL